MAYSTESRIPNAVVGVPQVAGDFDKFASHSSPKFNLGYKVETSGGKIYRYSHFGADTNRGVLVGVDLNESSENDLDNEVIAPASANNTSDGTIGSKFLEINLDAATSDSGADIDTGQFAGGTLVITDDTGEGYSYNIVGNTASDVPADQNIRMELAEPLQVALDATSDIAIQGSPYSNLEIATAATDAIVSGVTCSTIDESAAAWGWIQTSGDCGVLQDAGTVAVGDTVVLSAITSGAIGAFGGTAGATAIDMASEEIVGTMIAVGDSTGHSVVKLRIGD